MTQPVIQVRDLSKSYQIRTTPRKPYHSLRDDLMDGFKNLVKGRWQTQETETFWALKDINFDINQGDVVGIIGRNGAGKSTLLKILSQIVQPSTGEITIRGRVGSLLEVGTGFHPELTGRENVFMNGAVLGMKRSEIVRKFDEIVAFAEVEKFLDTPVKFYSSGMYVRLAFAVAAHLEPEVLIVDEVLAVGDATFQKKCLGKMEDVSKTEGKTVLFVSHNMAAVEKLCENGLFLHQGQVAFTGTRSETITKYLTSVSTDMTTSLKERKDHQGNGLVRIIGIEFKDVNGNPLEFINSGQTIDIYFYFENSQENISRIIASFVIKTQLEVPVFLQHNRLTGTEFGNLPRNGIFISRIYDLPLPSAIYQLSYFVVQDDCCLDSMTNAINLSVIDGDFFGSGEVPPISHGVSLVKATWRLESS